MATGAVVDNSLSALTSLSRRSFPSSRTSFALQSSASTLPSIHDAARPAQTGAKTTHLTSWAARSSVNWCPAAASASIWRARPSCSSHSCLSAARMCSSAATTSLPYNVRTDLVATSIITAALCSGWKKGSKAWAPTRMTRSVRNWRCLTDARNDIAVALAFSSFVTVASITVLRICAALCITFVVARLLCCVVTDHCALATAPCCWHQPTTTNSEVCDRRAK